MDRSRHDEWLIQEYLQLQTLVDGFHARALTVKAWSVTFSATSLGFAYVEDEPALLAVATVSALVFWLVESVWATHQHAYFPRIAVIEAYFAGGPPPPPYPFQIRRAWRDHFGEKLHVLRWLNAIRSPQVMLPYAVIFVGGIGLWLLRPP